MCKRLEHERNERRSSTLQSNLDCGTGSRGSQFRRLLIIKDKALAAKTWRVSYVGDELETKFAKEYRRPVWAHVLHRINPDESLEE